MLLKICRVCGETKDIEEYHVKKISKDGHRNECKECVKIIQKKYKESSTYKENRKEYDNRRYIEKRKEILDRKKEYYKENKESILKKKSIYRSSDEYKKRYKKYRYNNKNRYSKLQSKYRKNNPHIVAWRSILYSTLKRLNTDKSSSTVEELGYSADELKKYIESKFLSGMTWENHGDWHIDHIKPVTLFDIKTPVKEVCALSNLQPLWKLDNLSKSNKV